MEPVFLMVASHFTIDQMGNGTDVADEVYF